LTILIPQLLVVVVGAFKQLHQRSYKNGKLQKSFNSQNWKRIRRSAFI
jgi:hypothetical protein